MTVVRTQIRDAVVSCLMGATTAGNAVWAARDWPSATDGIETGQILVFALRERKDRVRSGALAFTTTATIEVIARIARGGPGTGLRMIDDLAQAVAAAVICNMPLRQLGIQFAPTVETEISYGSQGDLAGIAQAKIDFSFEYPERYQPGGVPLVDIQVNKGVFGSFDAPIPQ